MDLLTTWNVHFTDHWHTQTSVLSLLPSPLAFSWQQLLPVAVIQIPALWSSCQLTTNWVPGWRPFHTNLLVFSSQADIQLTTINWTLSLTKQLCHITLLNWTADNQQQLGWYPYYITLGQTQQKTPTPTILLLSWRLPSDRLDIILRECVYRPLLRNEYLFIRLLHSNGCTHPFRSLCPATGLYATIY
jgi:hypothetical protein